MPFISRSPTWFTTTSVISLVFFLLPIYLQKPCFTSYALFHFTCLVCFNGSQILVLLISYLHPHMVFLFSVVYPIFCFSYSPFWCLSSVRWSLFDHIGFLWCLLYVLNIWVISVANKDWVKASCVYRDGQILKKLFQFRLWEHSNICLRIIFSWWNHFMSLISELYIKAETCYPSLSELQTMNKSICHHLFVTVMKGLTVTLDLELECQIFFSTPWFSFAFTHLVTEWSTDIHSVHHRLKSGKWDTNPGRILKSRSLMLNLNSKIPGWRLYRKN